MNMYRLIEDGYFEARYVDEPVFIKANTMFVVDHESELPKSIDDRKTMELFEHIFIGEIE